MARRKKGDLTAALGLPPDYAEFLESLKARVRQAQTQAILAVNRELIRLYWDIGQEIAQRQEQANWGQHVLERLADDLQKALPGVGGFSRSNVFRMRAFYLAYRTPGIVAQPVRQTNRAKVAQAVRQTADVGPPEPVVLLPWGHNVVLIQKVKAAEQRLWYAAKAVEHGWSRAVLTVQIETDLFGRQGQAVTNFSTRLPPPQSDLAQQSLKDPYLFDVRHDNRVVIADAVSRILGRRYLSRPTYLGSKDDRDHSLLVKRWWATKCPDPRAARLAKHGEGYTA